MDTRHGAHNLQEDPVWLKIWGRQSRPAGSSVAAPRCQGVTEQGFLVRGPRKQSWGRTAKRKEPGVVCGTQSHSFQSHLGTPTTSSYSEELQAQDFPTSSSVTVSSPSHNYHLRFQTSRAWNTKGRSEKEVGKLCRSNQTLAGDEADSWHFCGFSRDIQWC